MASPQLIEGRLPLHFETAAKLSVAIASMLISAGLVAFAGMVASQVHADPTDSKYSILFLIIAVLLFINGLMQAVNRQVVDIDADYVRYRSRTLLGSRQWVEPLDNYRGLLFTRRHIRQSDSAGYDFYEVFLDHPSSQRRICLISGKSEAAVRRDWEQNCKLLKLPALEKDGEQIVSRSSGDLDRQVQLPREEGHSASALAGGVKPPANISITETADGTELAIRATRPFIVGANELLLYFIIVLSFMVFAIGGAINIDAAQPLLPQCLRIAGPFIPPLFILGGILAFAAWVLTQYFSLRIYINAREIHLLPPKRTHRFPVPTRATLVLPLATIETITIDKHDGFPSILLNGDHGTVALGKGLHPAAQQWLKDYLRARIAVKNR